VQRDAVSRYLPPEAVWYKGGETLLATTTFQMTCVGKGHTMERRVGFGWRGWVWHTHGLILCAHGPRTRSHGPKSLKPIETRRRDPCEGRGWPRGAMRFHVGYLHRGVGAGFGVVHTHTPVRVKLGPGDNGPLLSTPLHFLEHRWHRLTPTRGRWKKGKGLAATDTRAQASTMLKTVERRRGAALDLL